MKTSGLSADFNARQRRAELARASLYLKPWAQLTGPERRDLADNGDMAQRQLTILYRRDKRKCQICGKRVRRREASRDHIVPLSKCTTLAQAQSMRNMRLTHEKCNQERGNEDLRLVG